jgi:glutamate decarboxylase
MVIHRVDLADDSSLLDIYATKASQNILPKFRMSEGRSEPRARTATFCTTWVEDEVKVLMADAIDKNMIDKDEYPQTAEIEKRSTYMRSRPFWRSLGGISQ